MDDEDTGPDEFDRLDELIFLAEISIASQKRDGVTNPKYYTNAEMIKLMMEEVDKERDVTWHQEGSQRWSVEVRYRGITFISVFRTKSFDELTNRRSD